MWMGETAKNVVAVFRLARQEQAVLFFDEADAIATRRSTSVDQGFQRESNTVVNVLLQELESFNGVVIFATNLAANFDPAFERRIRTHVLFEMPGVDEREQIWRVQMHPTLTPLADDVNFRELAEKYEVSGGDIRNAVLKAALSAAAEPLRDTHKLIHQRHLDEGIRDVIASKRVMKQSLFDGKSSGDGAWTHPVSAGRPVRHCHQQQRTDPGADRPRRRAVCPILNSRQSSTQRHCLKRDSSTAQRYAAVRQRVQRSIEAVRRPGVEKLCVSVLCVVQQTQREEFDRSIHQRAM